MGVLDKLICVVHRSGWTGITGTYHTVSLCLSFIHTRKPEYRLKLNLQTPDDAPINGQWTADYWIKRVRLMELAVLTGLWLNTMVKIPRIVSSYGRFCGPNGLRWGKLTVLPRLRRINLHNLLWTVLLFAQMLSA